MTRTILPFLCLGLLIVQLCDAQKPKGHLENKFPNVLISDLYSHIDRNNPILILEHDELNDRIRTNYQALNNLKVTTENDKGWFMNQSEDSKSLIKIIHIDFKSGWISLEKVDYHLDLDEHIEPFNPLINYQIINNGPLLKARFNQ
jgi:hypothetical protein